MLDLPPHDLAAEQELLGYLLANNRYLELIWWMSPEHFADPIHGLLFAAIVELAEAGKLADVITLSPITAMPWFEEVGGKAYLANLLMAVADDVELGAHRVRRTGYRVAEMWRQRQRINWDEKLRLGRLGQNPPFA